MYRYTRGQQSFARASWGAHGARTSSPEPSLSDVPLEAKDNRALTPNGQEATRESIAQAEQDLLDLRNACHLKDQRIAELQKSDVSGSRLKREIRELAEVLHEKRKELSHAHANHARLQAMSSQRPLHQEPRDLVETNPTNTEGSDTRAQERIGSLQDENQQIRERIASMGMQRIQRSDQGSLGLPMSSPQHRAASREGSYDSRNFRRPPDNTSSGVYGNSSATTASNGAVGASRYPTIAAFGSIGSSSLGAGTAQQLDDATRQLVYSSLDHNSVSALGQIPLQGVGMVDGASGVAKILLQRLGSSVYHQPGRRQNMPQAAGHPQMAPAPQLAQPGPGL